MGCAISYDKQVCLQPGVNAYEITGASAGKVCLGRTPFRWEITLPFGNDPFSAPLAGDAAAIFMQLYQAGRFNHLFFSTIIDGAGVTIPRASWDLLDIFLGGFFYRSDNWLGSAPEDATPQDLTRGIPLGAFECETYVRCYGNPMPTQCLPTFTANENKAAMTFGYAGIDFGPLTVRGMAVIDYGMVPMDKGKCYMDNPVPGVDPIKMVEAIAAASRVPEANRPEGSGASNGNPHNGGS